MKRTLAFSAVCVAGALCLAVRIHAQEEETSTGAALRGSLVEDRAARKLLEAGDVRYDADEVKEALEIWASVIERYPRSRVRFNAHMRLGNYFLERDRAYEKARAHFEAAISEENRDEEQQAEALLKTGICFYEGRLYGQCFKVMRDVIEQYPVSPQVNQAYHYIGLGHFQLGHYSRAIEALEKVGTALENQEGRGEKVVAGKRLFIKIDDADLAALEADAVVKVRCESASGDVETVSCYPVGRNVRLVLGTIVTRLGKPIPDNNELEVKGDDTIQVFYTDRHTADKKVDQEVLRKITVVGDAKVQITDGAFAEALEGVVIGKSVNMRISDPDRDLADSADSIQAVVEIFRSKTDEEIEIEAAALAAQSDTTNPAENTDAEDVVEKIDPLKRVDRLEVTLVEAEVERRIGALAIGAAKINKTEANPPAETASPAAEEKDEKVDKKPEANETGDAEAKPEDDESQQPAEETEAEPAPQAPEEAAPDDGSIHSGVFHGSIVLVNAAEANEQDDQLQALPGDTIRVSYLDERHSGEGIKEVQAKAKCLEGNIGGVRVTKAVISDEELRINTRLKTASALTNIGNRYKEFGLKSSADAKYTQALAVCDEIMTEARKLGGRMLEETYVQLWKIYFEMDQLELAGAMAQRLQQEFPTSGFVDDALLQLGEVARKQGNLQRAIGIYNRLVAMKSSQLRGEAQFGIAECYEQMADQASEAASVSLYDRSFQEYKKVFDQFPESGRVGEAVAKMANHYYKQKDYARAIDTFETVLNNHPDAKFLDVVLFNYGRCLYRMERRGEARSKFDQLIGEYPQSALAGDAKKISDALRKAGI